MKWKEVEGDDLEQTSERIEQLRNDLQMIVKMDATAALGKDDALAPRKPPVVLDPNKPPGRPSSKG